MTWQKLVETSVKTAPIRVVDLDLESGNVAYSRRIRQGSAAERKATDVELVRAELVNRFVNEMSYAPEQVELDHAVELRVPETDQATTRYVDVVVNGTDGKPFFFACVREPGNFGEGLADGHELLEMAEAEYHMTGNAVQYLFYYTVIVRNGELSSDSVIINFQHFVHGLEGLDKPGFSGTGDSSLDDARLRTLPLPKTDTQGVSMKQAVVNRYKGNAYPVLLRIRGQQSD